MYSFFPSLSFLLFLLVSRVKAFSFSLGDATQCDNLSVTWSGGTAPFQLLAIPVFGTPRNISVPSSAFNNGQGSYSFQLAFPEKQRFLVTMSDATGFGAGGTSDVLTVGASVGGQSCNTKDPGIAFPFQLNTALTQCRPYIFSAYDQAIQPITIYGIIPAGDTFVLNPPQGPTSFTWTANVAHGTSVIFAMVDSQGRQGGSSDVMAVGISDDSSCLDSSSPSSTSALPASTTSGSLTSSNPSTTTSSSPSESTTAAGNGNISIGAIAGTVIGGLLFLAAIITLGLFFLRKRRDGDRYTAGTGGGGGGFGGQNNQLQSQLDLNYDPHNPSVHPYGGLDANSTAAFTPGYDQYSHSTAGLPYDSNPFSDNPPSQYPPVPQFNGAQYAPSQYGAGSQHTTTQYPPPTPSQFSTYHSHTSSYPPPPPRTVQSDSEGDPFNPYLPSPSEGGIIEPFELRAGNTSSRDSMSTAQRKAAMAGNTTYKPSRFILHTDLEDAVPAESEEEVVELPPQYSERRVPLVGPDPTTQPTSIHPLSSITQPSSASPASKSGNLPLL